VSGASVAIAVAATSRFLNISTAPSLTRPNVNVKALNSA
jgi:hypothetical protein